MAGWNGWWVGGAAVGFVMCNLGVWGAAAWGQLQGPGAGSQSAVAVNDQEDKKQKLYLLKSADGKPRLDVDFGSTAGPADEGGGKKEVKAFPWTKFISPQALEKEVAETAGQNPEHLANASVFTSKGYKKVRDNHTLLASMFNVASQYDGDMKWKAEGAGVRDLLAGVPMKIADDVKPDDAMFAEAAQGQQAVEKLLAGGASGAAAGSKTRPWSEVAQYNAVMRRMEAAQDRKIRAWTGSADEFNKNLDAVAHEAQVLAVLCQVIMDKSYPTAEGDDYQEWAKKLQQDCLDVMDAVKTKDQAKASKAAASMVQQCQGCHGVYR